jgi:hypothetical protein
MTELELIGILASQGLPLVTVRFGIASVENIKNHVTG